MNTRTIQSACLFLTIAVAAFAQVAPTSQPSSTSTSSGSTTSSASKPKPASRPFVAAAAQLAAANAWIHKPATNEPVEAFGPACELRFRQYKEPKPLHVWVAKIDLAASGVRISATEPATLTGDAAKFETTCQNTVEFARNRGVQLAFNASAFSPFRARAGEPMEVVGLAAEDGRVFSPVVDNRPYGAMFVSQDGRVSLKGPPLSADGVWDVIPGFRMLVDDGNLAVTDQEANTDFGDVNPRTAVGVDAAGKTLWVVVVDGRQKGVSVGATLVEMAALFMHLGVHDALNFDGGGSSTLVLESKIGTFGVVNIPVGQRAPGSLRQVANNIGVYLPGAAPAAAGKPAGLGDTLTRFVATAPVGGEFSPPSDAEREVLLAWLSDGDPDRLTQLRSDRGRVLSMLAEATRWQTGVARGEVAGQALGQWLRGDVEPFLHAWYGGPTTAASMPATASKPTSAPSSGTASVAVVDWAAPGPVAELVRLGAAEAVEQRQLAARGDLVQWSRGDTRHVGVYWGRDFDERGRERIWVWSAGENLRGLPIAGRENPSSGAGFTWLTIGVDVPADSLRIARPVER